MLLRDFLEWGDAAKLARTLGIPPKVMNLYARAHRRPDFERALRISAATGGQVSVEELMRPDAPFPIEARLRACDPVPTPEELEQLEREQLRQLGIDMDGVRAAG